MRAKGKALPYNKVPIYKFRRKEGNNNNKKANIRQTPQWCFLQTAPPVGSCSRGQQLERLFRQQALAAHHKDASWIPRICNTHPHKKPGTGACNPKDAEE